MRTLDRYIVRSFLVTAGLFLVAMLMLRIVADLFVNIDEFAEIETTFLAKVAHVTRYYGYQCLTYFIELGGVIIVASAAFTLARMNHSNELTAMLAAGVSLHRVTLPIVLCAMAMGGLVIVDQEALIPRVAYELTMKRDDIPATKAFEVRGVTDPSGSCWYARNYQTGKQVMNDPVILVRGRSYRLLARLGGSKAYPGEVDRQAGWFIEQGVVSRANWGGEPMRQLPDWQKVWSSVSPRHMVEQAARAHAEKTGQAVALERIAGWPHPSASDERFDLAVTAARFEPASPRDDSQGWGGLLEEPRFTIREASGQVVCVIVADWARWASDEQGGRWELEHGRLFYPTEMTGQDLALRESGKWLQYISTTDLTRLIQMDRVSDRAGAELTKHSRFTAPLNNLVMLLLALPFILSRERNIRASASMCLMTVGVFFLFVYLCRHMQVSPLMAAWLPIFVFGPVSVLMLDAVKT